MSEIDADELRVRIAEAAMSGIREYASLGKLPEDVDDALLLEAMLLCMQMLGGPQLTAQVIRYSFVMVSDK